MIESLLDTDLYKLTMQAVVHTHFRDAIAEYQLLNRTSRMQFNAESITWIEEQIENLGKLRFTDDEITYMKRSLPFLPNTYFDFIESCQLDPEKEVQVFFDTKTRELEISVKGYWHTTILYEIPILATVSEAYFRFIDTDWNTEGQWQLAHDKASKLLEHGCKFIEFGTRRRRSIEVQELVLRGIINAANGSPNQSCFLGTSNVYFAKKFGLKPMGTVAHELIMGVAAYMHDYSSANQRAMDLWLSTVGSSNAGFALTDTFGTPKFLEGFKPPYSDVYLGVRQDSGDPLLYTRLISQHYKNLDYPPLSKCILYSDSLNVEKCIEYKKAAEDAGLKPLFGIGTSFTNDFFHISQPKVKSKPLNIVMKLKYINGYPAVKLSDVGSKTSGSSPAVEMVKEKVGYPKAMEGNAMTFNESDRW